MISIGVVTGGPESAPIEHTIRRAMKLAIEYRDGIGVANGPSVNVVFYVPGRINVPDWNGLRHATYSRKQNLLMVQVAVPPEVAALESADGFVVESLRGANAICFEFFRQKNMHFPLAEAESLVSRIEAGMQERSQP